MDRQFFLIKKRSQHTIVMKAKYIQQGHPPNVRTVDLFSQNWAELGFLSALAPIPIKNEIELAANNPANKRLIERR